MNPQKTITLNKIVAFLLVIASFQCLQAQNLVGHWTFETGSELVDLQGNFSDLTFGGSGAVVSGGALDVGNGNYARGVGYTGPSFTEKTLISWVRLDDLNLRAGSVLTLDKTNVDQFDGIVYAELQSFRWMPGSNFFQRTNNPTPGFAETTTGELVQMAITYADNGGGSARVRIYRNGTLIGDYVKGSLLTVGGATTEVLFGTRHTQGSSPRSYVDAKIEEARVYDGVLTQAEIQALTISAPAAIPALSEWGIFLYFITILILGLVAFINVNRQTAFATSQGNVSISSNLRLPFDQQGFFEALKITLMIVPFGFAFIYLGWGEIIIDDFIGMTFAIPLVAYLTYLLRIKK